MTLETEVPEKVQPILRGPCFLSMRLIIDINPMRKDLLYPFQETDSNRIGVLFPPGKELWKRPIPRLGATRLINPCQRLATSIGDQTKDKHFEKCEVLAVE